MSLIAKYYEKHIKADDLGEFTRIYICWKFVDTGMEVTLHGLAWDPALCMSLMGLFSEFPVPCLNKGTVGSFGSFLFCTLSSIC